jgi:D-alanyl-D-alanine carboxypeptidase
MRVRESALAACFCPNFIESIEMLFSTLNPSLASRLVSTALAISCSCVAPLWTQRAIASESTSADVMVDRIKAEPLKLSPEKFDQYVGQYELAAGLVLAVSREGGKFFTRATGQGLIEIQAETEEKFFARETNAQLKFVKDAAGKVTHLILHQAGRETLAKRVVAATTSATIVAPAVARQEIALPDSAIDAIIGEYELETGLMISIWREGRQLMGKANQDKPMEIFAESETKFFLKAIDAQLRFDKDASGNVNQIVLFLRGREAPGKKLK